MNYFSFECSYFTLSRTNLRFPCFPAFLKNYFTVKNHCTIRSLEHVTKFITHDVVLVFTVIWMKIDNLQFQQIKRFNCVRNNA